MIYKVKSRETNKIDELSSGIALSFLYNTLLGRLIHDWCHDVSERNLEETWCLER